MYNVHVYVCIIRTHTEILTPTHTHTQNIVKTMYIQLLTSLSLMGNQVCQRRVRLLDHCVSDNRDRPCDPSLQRSSLKTGLFRTKTWFFSFFFMNSPRKTATMHCVLCYHSITPCDPCFFPKSRHWVEVCDFRVQSPDRRHPAARGGWPHDDLVLSFWA